MELLNIAAYAYQDVHVWSALLTCLRPGLTPRCCHTRYTFKAGKMQDVTDQPYNLRKQTPDEGPPAPACGMGACGACM